MPEQPRHEGDVEYRSAVPDVVKEAARAGWRTWASATRAGRLLPDHLLIGGQRCGSTSLHKYLVQHPSVGRPTVKEVRFFDLHFGRGVGWYRSHFPTAAFARWARRRHGVELRVGEASPDYLFAPRAPQRVASVLPQAKLLVLLRDPVARAYSHYQKEVARGYERLSFEEAIAAEPERLQGEADRLRVDPSYQSYSHEHFSYLARGVYADQLSRWLEFFPRDQVWIVQSEDLFNDPDATYASALRFLGLPARSLSAYPRRNVRRYDALPPRLERQLRRYFDPHNERLSDLLGREFRWGR